MSGENLDLTSTPNPDGEGGDRDRSRQRYLGILFECCRAYGRIYINQSETAYAGHCPRCGHPLQVKIGPGGTDARFFTLS